MPFCVASRSLWFMSLFFLDKCLTGILQSKSKLQDLLENIDPVDKNLKTQHHWVNIFFPGSLSRYFCDSEEEEQGGGCRKAGNSVGRRRKRKEEALTSQMSEPLPFFSEVQGHTEPQNMPAE